MKTRKTFEIEIQRRNVTPAQFLTYVRNRVDAKGGRWVRSDLDDVKWFACEGGYKQFASNNGYSFGVPSTHPCAAERSKTAPYDHQTYVRGFDGSVYNEIIEFQFDDEKTGFGYYYLVNVEVDDADRAANISEYMARLAKTAENNLDLLRKKAERKQAEIDACNEWTSEYWKRHLDFEVQQIARDIEEWEAKRAEAIGAEEEEKAETAEEIAEEAEKGDKEVKAEKKTEKAKKEYRRVECMGYTIPCEVPKSGKAGKLERDVMRVRAILEKGEGNLTAADRLELLRIYNVAYHEGGKIEGVFSLDSSATNCGFCAKMRAWAAKNPDLKIVCDCCYDVRQEGYKINTLGRHTLNMIIMQTVDFTVEELRTLPVYGLVRVNSSGDAPNDTYAANMIKFCFAHLECNVAIWSKNTVSYIRACDKYGKPENVTMIQSSPFIDKAVKRAKYFDLVFTVYMDAEKVQEAIEGGAYECNGKKCAECGYKCYTKAWKSGGNIAELLRK